MGFFDQFQKQKGGYIFLSHSHDDIEKVRQIRNSLEWAGFEPLCFYLKCLQDDDEIEDLIKREIDAREWFVFVDSENSRKSKWVTMEREYIKRTDSKKIITVDLKDADAVDNAIYKITHNLRIFISYSGKDRALARQITNKLREKDYLVFFDEDSLSASNAFVKTITGAVKEAAQEGCVLALLTESALRSQLVQHEILLALQEGGNILPIFFGDAQPDAQMSSLLRHRQHYRLSDCPTDAEIDKLVDILGRYMEKL